MAVTVKQASGMSSRLQGHGSGPGLIRGPRRSLVQGRAWQLLPVKGQTLSTSDCVGHTQPPSRALLCFCLFSQALENSPKHSKLADCAKPATVCLLVVEEKTPALSWLGSSPDPPSPSAVSFVWLLYLLCAWGTMGVCVCVCAGTWVGLGRGGVHKSPSPEGVVESHDFRHMKPLGDGGCEGHSVAPALANRFGREDAPVWWSFRVCHFPVGAGHRKMSTKRDVPATFCAAGRINTVCFEY